MNAVLHGNASRRLAWGCALLVAVAACWQTRDTIDFAFVEFDDSINIFVNPHLGPPSRATLSWMFGDMEYMRRYVPLGWLGFSCVYGFSGLAPAGYHAANVALHVVNSALVFAVLLLLLRRFATAVDEGARLAAALVGALWWSLHPFRAETVGWASGLLYGLAGCFAWLSVLTYLQAWSPGVARGRRVIAAALLYAASLLVYPMSLGLVGGFVLIDLAHRLPATGLSWRRLALEKALLAVPALAVFALTLVASFTAPEYWPRPPSWTEFGWGVRLEQAACVWTYYLWKPWWPTDLTPVPTWLVGFNGRGVMVGISLAVVVGVSVALLAGWRRWRGTAILWFAHVGLLVPMLGLTERPHYASDRYHYLAGGVMALALSLVLARVVSKARIPTAIIAGIGLAALGVVQRGQLAIWADTDTLMQRISARANQEDVRRNYQERWIRHHLHRGEVARAAEVAAQTGVPLAQLYQPEPEKVPMLAALHMKLALDFRRAGRRTEAHEHFREALQLAPDWCEAAYNWGLLHASEGAPREGLRWYRRAVAPGRGNPVPAAARQRLLSVLAEGFFAEGRALLAVRTIELAWREGGDPDADPGLARQLQAQAARFSAAPKR